MTYRTAILKRNIELIAIFPFILLGKIIGTIFPLKTKHSIFIFSPSTDIGGSIKVNADILECIKDKKPLVILSKRPKNNQFRHLFEIEGVRIIDLHKYIDYKIYHYINFFFRGVIAAWINKAECPVVFGGESLFFYKIVPHVKKQTRVVELCHLNTWLNFSQAFIKYIDFRIFSTQKIKRDVILQYQKNNVPPSFLERLYFTDNKIEIPVFQESTNSKLEVLYVGRGAPQKRVHLIAEIAKRMHETDKPVHFSFVGDVENVIPESAQKYCILHGQIKNQQELDTIYTQSDVLLLTSAYEGLPIVVMEMMARGKVVISTAVDGIPDYIIHEKTGLLITETQEEKIINKGVELLNKLIHNTELIKTIGKNSREYAMEHFNGETFCKFYRDILAPKE